MIRDKNVEWLEARIYIPSWNFQTWGVAAGAVVGVGAGTPETVSEIGTTGMVAARAGAAGDEWMHLWMVPYDIDRSKQVRFRVWWTSSSADADTPLWKVFYSALAEDGTLIQPATALDTVIATDTADGADKIKGTDFGVINKNTIAAATYFLNLTVESDNLGGASANELGLAGLEVRYTPRRMSGPEKNLRGARRLATASPLGVTLAATQEGA